MISWILTYARVFHVRCQEDQEAERVAGYPQRNNHPHRDEAHLPYCVVIRVWNLITEINNIVSITLYRQLSSY